MSEGDPPRLPRLSDCYAAPPRVEELRRRPAALLVISALPGFGRASAATYLLRDLHGIGHRVGWVSAARLDGSPEALWWRLAQEVAVAGELDVPTREVRTETGRRAADVQADRGATAGVAMLRETVSRLQRPVTIAIGDLDAVVHTGVDAVLVELVRHSDFLHLVVTTVPGRPIVTLAWSAVEGAVVRARELAFTADLARRVAARMGAPLSRGDLRVCIEELGGWPALVVGVIARIGVPLDVSDPGCRVIAVGQARRALERLPGTSTRMALGVVLADSQAERADLISVADPEHGDLGEAIDRVVGDFGLTEALVPRSDGGRSMLAQVITEALVECDPPGVEEVARRLVARVCAEGRPHDALRYAIGARDWPGAAEVAGQHWEELLSSRARLVEQVMQHVPAMVLDRHPALAAVRELASLEELRRRAGEAVSARRLLPGRMLRRPPMLDMLIAAGEGPADADVVAGRLMRWADALCVAGEDVPAAYVLALAVEVARPGGRQIAAATEAVAAVLALCGHLMDAGLWLGSLDRSGDDGGGERGETAQPAEALPAEALASGTPSSEAMTRAMVAHALAFARLEAVEAMPPESAAPAASLRALTVDGPAYGSSAAVTAATSLLAWRCLRAGPHHVGMLRVARAAIEEEAPGARRVRSEITARIVEAQLAAGAFDAAEAELDSWRGSDDPASAQFRVAAARVALYCGMPDRALHLSAADPRFVAEQPGLGLESLVIQACAAWRLGSALAARDALATAVGIAQRLRWYAPFVTVPRTDLRQIAAPAPGLLDFLGSDPLGAAAEAFPAPAARDTLTDAELRVLQALAEAESMRELSRALYLAPGTVKTHLQRVYRKLGVNGRDDALAAARRLRLL